MRELITDVRWLSGEVWKDVKMFGSQMREDCRAMRRLRRIGKGKGV